MKISNKSISIIFLFTFILGACSSTSNGVSTTTNQDTETPEIIIASTSTPEPIVNLTICTQSVPQSVSEMLESKLISAALFGYQPHPFSDYLGLVLFDIPSPINNSLYQQLISVNLGDTVVNNSGDIIELTYGTWIKPAGCINLDCAMQYDGTPVEMAQMVAVFDINSNLSWQDGESVTPADSVFAFQWNKENNPNRVINETQFYSLDDAGKIKWIGIPGLFSQQILEYLWSPLPAHLWEGKEYSSLSFDDIVGYGPFQLDFQVNQDIVLKKNQLSHNSESTINQITIHEISSDGLLMGEAISSNECDVIENTVVDKFSPDGLLSDMENGEYKLVSGNGDSWVSLYLGIVPQSYDEIYSMWGGDRADYFGQIEIRQFISQCVDSQYAQLNFGDHGTTINGLFPENHVSSLLLENIEQVSFDLTDALLLPNWPLNSEGIRSSLGNINIFDGTPFEISLHFPDTLEMQKIAQRVGNQLIDCGIKVNLQATSNEDLFQSGSDGLVFGRNFDLALIPWQTSLYSVCELLSPDAVPGADLESFPYGWGGWNATGWQSQEYSDACNLSLISFIDSDQYRTSNQSAQANVQREAPIIPLFVEPSFWVVDPALCGVQVDELSADIIKIEAIDFKLDGETNCP